MNREPLRVWYSEWYRASIVNPECALDKLGIISKARSYAVASVTTEPTCVYV